MMQAIWPFALASLLIELTPGPNMTYLALVSVTVGRRAGYAATAGVALGLALLGLAAALGLAVVITESPPIYATLRWLGVAYFIYLAWDAWHDSAPSITVRVENDTGFFLRGLISNLLNPKAAIFYVAVLPTFIDPARPPEWQALTLTAIYVVVATIVHAGIVTLAGFLRPMLANDRLVSLTSRIFAVALLCIAAWLAWSTR
jgi:threonine/homoserine/homoserine lactone efflux protein